MPKDEKIKFGLWEDGKRIEWFDQQQVQAINMGEDYTHFFHNTESETMIERDACFRKPYYFDDKLSEVKKKIAQRAAKGFSP